MKVTQDQNNPTFKEHILVTGLPKKSRDLGNIAINYANKLGLTEFTRNNGQGVELSENTFFIPDPKITTGKILGQILVKINDLPSGYFAKEKDTAREIYKETARVIAEDPTITKTIDYKV